MAPPNLEPNPSPLANLCRSTCSLLFCLVWCILPFTYNPIAPPFLVFLYLCTLFGSFIYFLEKPNRCWQHVFHLVMFMLAFCLSIAALIATPFYPVGIVLTVDLIYDCIDKFRQS